MNKIYFLVICVICAIIQLVPFNEGAAVPAATNSSRESLLEFYDKELQIMAKEFCEKAKNVSKTLLEVKDIKEASTPELKEFQKFLQMFLRDFTHFKRYNIYGPLLEIFLDLSKKDHTKQNFNLILEKYFANPLQKFKQNYEKFIKEDFLTKIADFKNQSNKEDVKDNIDYIKSCQDYECLTTNLEYVFEGVNATKELSTAYLPLEEKKLLLLISINCYNVAKGIQQDEQFSQLSSAAKQNITKDIKNYSTNFENHQNISEFWSEIGENLNYPIKYDWNMKNSTFKDLNFSLSDEQIFKKIVNKYKFEKEKSLYEKRFAHITIGTILKMMLFSSVTQEKTKLIVTFG
ncbi:uncharacterized protein ACRADG_004550 [Cochliomyia hominivorax]